MASSTGYIYYLFLRVHGEEKPSSLKDIIQTMNKNPTKLKSKVIPREDGHTLKCGTCYEMERRGYKSEDRYWSDFFADKLKPVKFKPSKGWSTDMELLAKCPHISQPIAKLRKKT